MTEPQGFRGSSLKRLLRTATGESVYGEKRVSVEVGDGEKMDKVEYRVWNPFRSKLAASILAGVDNIHIKPGAKVLYLGAASGTSVSHVSDIVGPEGSVYAVEFSHRSGMLPSLRASVLQHYHANLLCCLVLRCTA